ncbi:MAG: amino acid ABC transporter permease [Anaerolineae bacterium]|nr:amino acid ABC transporter permease [Anaerolineae bacterium]
MENTSKGNVPPNLLSESASDFVVVRPFPWRSWVELIFVILVVGWVLFAAVRSGVVSLPIIAQFLLGEGMLIAVVNTLILATLGTVIALVLGIGVALLRVGPDPVLSRLAAAYVYFFRGVPMLIQILFWFNALPVMIRVLYIEVPLTGTVLVNVPTIEIITPFVAALLGLSLAETGYMAEVVRSGMLGVDRGQRDAARALGLMDRTIQLRIVVPQGLRIVVPSIGNEYITMLKNTSLAYIIGYNEILRRTSDIYTSNFRVMELLVVAAFWYLVLTTLVSFLQNRAERWFPAR